MRFVKISVPITLLITTVYLCASILITALRKFGIRTKIIKELVHTSSILDIKVLLVISIPYNA